MQYKRQRKLLIWIMVGIMIFSLFPASVGYAETTSAEIHKQNQLESKLQSMTNSPTENTIKSESESKKTPFEEKGMRKANEKVINNQDGTYTKKIFSQPVHFRENGKWEEISSDLVEKNGNEYKPKNTELDVSFQKIMKYGEYVNFQQDNSTLSVRLVQASGENGIVRVNSSKSSIKGNKIWYKQVFPNIDLRNILFNDSVKEDIVLNKYTGHNQFQFQINTQLKPKLQDDGSVKFFDDQEKEIYTIPKPFMSDSNINPESGEAAISEEVRYEVKQIENDKYLLTLIADNEWIKSSERKFPIYIDPTYTKVPVKNFVNGYVSSAYPNNNYSGTKLWDATQGAYILKVGYYDSTTGDNYAYLKNNLSDLQGAVISKATLWLYTQWSYSTTPTNVWVSTAKTNWDPSAITWNYSPSVTNLGYASTVRDSWFSFDVTSTVQKWANTPSSNYGFALHTNGNGQTYWKKFIASQHSSNVPEIDIIFTFLDKPTKPIIKPYANTANSSTGYFDISWSAVDKADGYEVGIYNGKSYDYFDVGNVTSWSTKGKGLFPTALEITNGSYGFHHDGKGGELANDPNSMYVASGGNYQSSHQYWFVVKAYNKTANRETIDSDWAEGYLLDTTSPNIPGIPKVVITDGALNSGDTAKATITWNSVTDLPISIGSGIDYYEINKYIDGSWKAVGTVINSGAANYSYNVTNLPDNTTNLKFQIRAVDKNKNSSAYSTSSAFITKDRTSPNTPTSLKVSPDTWTNSSKFTLTWEGITDESSLQTIQYSIDGGSWISLGTNASNGTSIITNTSLADGKHEIKVRGIDTEGNYGNSKSVYYYKDTVAPSILIDSPGDGEVINGVVDIKATINSTNAPLSKWKIEYGEGDEPLSYSQISAGTSLVSNEIIYSWDTSALTEQTTYTLRIETQDTAGNINRVVRKVIKGKNVETISKSIDVSAPLVQETVLIPSYQIKYLVDKVNPSSFDNYTGELFVNSKLAATESKVAPGLFLDATKYAEGSSNKFYIRFKDNLGQYRYNTTSYRSKGVVDTFIDNTKIENLSGISNVGQALQLQSATKGTVESKKQHFAGDIQTIYLTPVEQKPSGTEIEYLASTDGGVTWQSIKPYQTEVLKQVGKDLKVKAVFTSTSSSVTPVLKSWDSDIVYVNSGQSFYVKLIDEPENLTATPNVNYMTLLRWDASTTSNVTYNIYRSSTESFSPSSSTLIASGIKDAYWNDFNLNYGQKFYYKVVASKTFNGVQRLSLPSNEESSRVVAKDELEKRLGLQDYWGYGAFSTGRGNGYINLSSGNLVYQSTDFVAPGPKLGMVMKRTFNSQSTTKTALGYGWDFSFNTNLLKEYDDAGKEVGLILKDGDGSLHRFVKGIDGLYQSPKGIFMTLIKKADGSYEILRKDQIKYVFDSNMKLINFSEPNGNKLTLVYDPLRGNLESITNNYGDMISFRYNSDDSLKYIIDHAGRVYNFLYDGSDSGTQRLIKTYQIIEDNTEYSEKYQYDNSFTELRYITDPKFNTTSLDYLNNKLTQVTDPLEEYTTINYVPNQTTLTTDKGKSTDFKYNIDGNITSKTNSLGHKITYEYDSNMLVKHMYFDNIINGVSKTLHYNYTYDNRGNILTYKDPLGNITEYKNYNSMNQVKDIIKPIREGVTATYHYEYDSFGNLQKTVDPEGRIVSYDYYDNGNQKTITNEFNKVTTFFYDIKGRLQKTVEPLGRTTEILGFDNQGNPSKIKDPNGYITSYKYDLLGRLNEISYPDGYTEVRRYDVNDNLVLLKNRRDFETIYKYDEVNRLYETQYRNGDIDTISYGYDSDANKKVVYSDSNDRKWSEYYDSEGQLIKLEKNNTTTLYGYDLVGNMTKITDSSGRVEIADYNELNQQTKTVVDPTGKNIVSQNIYDLDGNVRTNIDGEGFATIYDYDKLGRIKEINQKVDGKEIITSYKYDLVDGDYVKNTVTDGEKRERITYLDALGRVAKEVDEGTPTDNERITESFEYDLNGNMKIMTRNDGTKEVYDYNSMNQLETITFSPDHVTTFKYDPNGNRKTMLDKKGTQSIETSYAFDSKDRLTSVVQDDDIINYQYDSSDNVTRVYYPTNEGDLEKDIDYIYDSNNRLDSILVEGKKAQQYFYTNSGQVDYLLNYLKFDTAGTSYVKVDYGYNTAGLTESIQYLKDGNSKIEEYKMVYDRRGFIKNEDIYTNYDAAKTVKKSYQYDEVGRLKSSTQDAKTTSYTYDAVGNRLTMNDGTDTYVYSYNQFNQLKTKTKNGQADSSYDYDLRGNQTKEITKRKIDGVLKNVTSSYQYDLANRLEQVNQTISGEQPVVEKNFYNGDGHRLRREVNGLVSKYFYDGDSLLYTTDANNIKATENVLGPGGTIVTSKRFDGVYDNMYFFYQYDTRGSVTSILGPDAKRIKGYGYDEFGNTEEIGSKSFINDVKFTGAVEDTATGLYYMNARHYNPDTGRFISQDTYKGTAGDPWSQHLYVYTTNNPVNFIDPTGHLPIYTGADGNDYQASPIDVPGTVNYGQGKSTKNYSSKKQPITPFDFKTNLIHPDPELQKIMMGIVSPGGRIKSGVTTAKSANSIMKKFIEKVFTKGTGNVGKFTQKTASPNFSQEGSFAGKTIGEVSNSLRSGALKTSDVPVEYIMRDGNKLLLNTRSSLALKRAGIPESNWVMVNKTGDSFLEQMLTQRLMKNGLTNAGTETLRITGSGRFMSNLK